MPDPYEELEQPTIDRPTISCACGGRRRRYHPCPRCGEPAFAALGIELCHQEIPAEGAE